MPESSKVVGKVSIKVIPDTDDFRKRTKRELKKAVSGLDVEIPVIPELDDSAVKRAKNDLKRHLGEVESHVKPEVDESSKLRAQARLGLLSRPRTVQLLPVVNTLAAKKAAATLAALSGGRVLNKWAREFNDFIANLDKSVPKYAAVGLGIMNIGAGALSAASNLFALSQSLAQIFSVSLALPGILAGIGIGIGATVAVLKDFGDVLPDVKGKFTDLQDSMSEQFWRKAEKPIRRFVDTLFPQFADGIEDTSKALGTFFADLANDATKAFDGQLGPMFDNLNESILVASKSTAAYVGIIRTLGLTGSEYLPRLADWFGRVATDFDDWLTEARNDGRLQQWIDHGIHELKELGRVASGLGSILASIARAAEAAGGSTLTVMADTLERIAKVAKGQAFQEGLTRAFLAAHEAIDQIATKSGPGLKRFLDELSQTMTTALPIAGETLGRALGAVFDALARPSVQNGIVSFFSGIRSAIMKLEPVMPRVGDAFGALLKTIGTLADNFAGPLSTAIGYVAEAIVRLAPAVAEASGPLSEMLTTFLQFAGPVILTVADALGAVIGVIGNLAEAFNSLPGPIKDLISVAGVAAAGFAVAGPWGAVAGAATSLFTLGEKAGGAAPKLDLFGDATARARTQAQELVDTLDAQSKKITDLTKKKAFEQLYDAGILDVAKEIGVSFGTVTEAVLGNKDAITRTKTAAEEYLAYLDTIPGADQTARIRIEELLKKIDTTGSAFEKARTEARLLDETIGQMGQGADGDKAFRSEAIKDMEENLGNLREEIANVYLGFGDLGQQSILPTVGLNDVPFLDVKGRVDSLLAALGLTVVDPKAGLDDSVLRTKNAEMLAMLGVLDLQTPTPKADLNDQAARTKLNALAASIPQTIAAASGAAYQAGTQVATSAGNGAATAEGKFASAGEAAGAGFQSGILRWLNPVAQAAASLAAAAASAARKELDVNSPSKVFRSIGGSVGEGFTQGMDRQVANVAKSARAIASAAIAPVSAQTVEYRARIRSGDLTALRAAVAVDTAAPVIKQFNYHAAENRSLSAEEELFQAADKARMAF